jgi:hypothetical protein
VHDFEYDAATYFMHVRCKRKASAEESNYLENRAKFDISNLGLSSGVCSEGFGFSLAFPPAYHYSRRD